MGTFTDMETEAKIIELESSIVGKELVWLYITFHFTTAALKKKKSIILDKEKERQS